jgi:hypothetical protein
MTFIKEQERRVFEFKLLIGLLDTTIYAESPAPFDRGSGVGSPSRSFAEGTAADVAAPAADAAPGCDETSLTP